jgi:hypothetical protein
LISSLTINARFNATQIRELIDLVNQVNRSSFVAADDNSTLDAANYSYYYDDYRDLKVSCDDWSVYNSFFFAFTAITTIGKSHNKIMTCLK